MHQRLVVRLEEAVKGGQRILKLDVPTANGRGRLLTKSQTLAIKIPAGVLPTQQFGQS